MRLKFRLSNGKKTFFQWDVNQKIILENPICTQVHFENKDISDKAYVKEVYKDNEGRSVVDIPDIFLQYTPGFLFYGYVISEDGKERFTEERGDVSVIRRAKPSDYVFTPEDQKTLEEVFDDAVKYIPEEKTDEEKANARENIEAEFKGNKVNAIGDDADDEHYPSTKAVKDYIRDSAVQADLGQNDEGAADFVRNRPGGYTKTVTETKTIVSKTNSQISPDDDTDLNLFPPFAVGDTVGITVNGTKYSLTAYNPKGAPPTVALIGDALPPPENPEYGWSLYTIEGAVFFANNTDGNMTVQFDLSSEKVVTIDPKYIPSVADWDENDETKAGYVKNRPFYDETELLAEFVNPCTSLSTGVTIDTTIELIAGNKYIVSINDDEYIVTAGVVATGWHVYSMGIGYYIEGFENVPFMIYVPCGTVDAVTGSGKMTVAFSEAELGSEIKLYKINNLVPIKERYFPDTIFSQKNAPMKFGDNTSSAIQGSDVTATGRYSHAEGQAVKASGDYSHSEGWRTESSGDYSHAEGGATVASGSHSHAEGDATVASGDYSHAEGSGTIADKEYLSVSGMYNLEDGKYGIKKSHQDIYLTASKLYGYSNSYHFYEDTGKFSIDIKGSRKPSKDLKNVYILDDNNKLQYIIAYKSSVNDGKTMVFDAINIWSSQISSRYIRVIGNGVNGSSGIVRSNAYTLDWDGNAWFSGDVYVGSTSGTNKDDGSKKLATVDDMEQGIQEIRNRMPHLYTVFVQNEIDNNGESTYTSNAPVIQIVVGVFPDLVNQTASINCLFAESEDDGSPVNKAMLLPCVNISNPKSIIPTPNTTFPIFAEFSANVSGKIITVRMESEVSFDADSKATISDDVITVTKKTMIPTPSTAVVGQVIKVKSIDSDGKILETEAVDLSSTSVNITYNEETGNLQIGG